MCDFLEPLLTCDIQKLKSLINLGRSVNSEIPTTEGLTPLHVAVGIEKPDGAQIVFYLLKNGANPNSKSFDELTPVHIATMWNNCLNLEMLLKHGGDPWLTDYENKNSFDMALHHNAYEAYQLLNKFVSLELLTPEQKAIAYQNGFFNNTQQNTLTYQNSFLNDNTMQLQSGKPFDRNKTDIIDVLLADCEESEITHFLTANENFPLYLSSTENETSELCCNVSKFLKKRDERQRFKTKSSDSVNEVKKSNTQSNKTNIIKKVNAVAPEICSNTVVGTESSDDTIIYSTIEMSEDGLNNGFLLSSTDSVSSQSSSFQNSAQFKNKIIEIDSDAESGIILVEECRPNSFLCETKSSKDQDVSTCTIISDWRSYQSGSLNSTLSNCSTNTSPDVEVPEALKKLSNSELYCELKQLGDNPGPVVGGTREIYLQRLIKLKLGYQTVCLLPKPKYCSEIHLFLDDKLDMERIAKLEEIMAEEFDRPSLNKKWREGTQRCSFNYFLLDPRVTKNLPARSHLLTLREKFLTFLDSLFYVGKGTRGRPYCHLYEAAKAMSSPQQNNEKIKHILDIWGADLGVISLHCFNNSIPVEAYTREACMIEAIGLSNLTNIKIGNFYGISARWTMSRKKQLGISFLHRALEIYLLEGERLIRPKDICKTI